MERKEMDGIVGRDQLNGQNELPTFEKMSKNKFN